MGFLTIAAIAGLVAGAATGATDYFSNLNATEKALQRQYRDLEKRRDVTLANMQLEYDIQKEQALDNAAHADRQSTLKEDFVSRAAENQIDQLIKQQDAQTLAYNNELAAMDAQEGDALSTMAASGTRGSSMQQAVDLQAGSNALQLQTAEDQTRAANNSELNSILMGIAENTEDIQSQRTAASDLRLSVDDGSMGNGQGSQYKLAQSAMNATKLNFNQQIKELKTQRNAMLYKHNIALGAMSAMFRGGASGMQTGYNLASTAQKIGFNVDTTGKLKFNSTGSNG